MCISDAQLVILTGDSASDLEGTDVRVRRAGAGSWQMLDTVVETLSMLEAFKNIRKQKVRTKKLSDVEQICHDTSDRVVLVL